MKLGSLFDGSGGFPLASSLCGIEPIWASEVEPYPIAVTKSRFPMMEHLGSVTEVNGAEVEPVDVLTFGSPCQDLSVAGKRAGLKHEDNGDDETTRSGLFMEAIRIIKEMREATNGKYPAFAIWENVPGAFSSNKGEDFRTVLEELIKTVEPTAVMPPVPKGGWAYADCFVGDGWSLAYRVLDAQYIRTAQRRRRIYLVLHLTGQRAGEVLFERESLRGNTPQSGTPRKRTAGDASDCTGTTDREGEVIPINMMIAVRHKQLGRGTGFGVGNQGDPQFTISAGHEHAVAYVVQSAGFKSGQGVKARSIGWEEEKSPTLQSEAGGNSVPSVCIKGYDARGYGDGETTRTITGGHKSSISDYTNLVIEPIPIHDKATRYQGGGPTRNGDGAGNGLGVGQPGGPAPTLSTCDRHAVCFQTYQEVSGPLMANSHPGSYTGQDAFNDMLVAGKEEVPIVLDDQGGSQISVRTDGKSPALRAEMHGNVTCALENDLPTVRYIVRRLTPTECARLQGFPDEWGHPVLMDSITDGDYRFWLEVRKTHAAINGKSVKDFTEQQIMTWYNKLHTDSAEYKMWGNGIALPCALYVMEGIAEALLGG